MRKWRGRRGGTERRGYRNKVPSTYPRVDLIMCFFLSKYGFLKTTPFPFFKILFLLFCFAFLFLSIHFFHFFPPLPCFPYLIIIFVSFLLNSSFFRASRWQAIDITNCQQGSMKKASKSTQTKTKKHQSLQKRKQKSIGQSSQNRQTERTPSPLQQPSAQNRDNIT